MPSPITGQGWKKFPLSLSELNINTTLRCGQSFRWRRLREGWTCSLRGRVVFLEQDKSCLFFKSILTDPPPRMSKSPVTVSQLQVTVAHVPVEDGVINQSPAERNTSDDDTAEMLHHYFNLAHNLGTLYEQWSHADPVFKKLAPGLGGVRILNQDAWEALVCFICSSNNNIARISSMAHKLCLHFGRYITTIHDEPWHDFPTPADLSAPDVESRLRAFGFGYRAAYIARTARIVAAKPPEWLNSLRNPKSPAWVTTICDAKIVPDAGLISSPITYKEAHAQLVSLPGVGPKVADCVCLMGLGWSEAVPVDTHVWQIAQRDYNFAMGTNKSKSKVATKTFSKGMYDAVGDHFRALWGEWAGWTHSVLFTAELKLKALERETANTTAAIINTPEAASVKSRTPIEEVVKEAKIEEGEQTTGPAPATIRRTKRRRGMNDPTAKQEKIATIEQMHAAEMVVRRSKRLKKS